MPTGFIPTSVERSFCYNSKGMHTNSKFTSRNALMLLFVKRSVGKGLKRLRQQKRNIGSSSGL